MDLFREEAFRGKTVFVAGGSTGINFAIAERFAELGANVALLSRSEERVTHAANLLRERGFKAIAFAADVRDYDAIEAALADTRARCGEIDVVISGAAGNFLAPAIGLSAKGFRTVVEIDLLGTFNVLRASFEHLRKPGACLISITAGMAKRPVTFQAHAAAAKAGINNLTQSLAMEWGPAGIRVNAVSPGPIADTEGVSRLLPNDKASEGMKRRIPLRDYGTKRDIAEAAVFLASDNAKYITGVILEVDGGMLLGDASVNALRVPESLARQRPGA